MNGPVLMGALLVPLLGALVAFAVPSGTRRARRRFPRADDGGDDRAEGAESEITLVVVDPDPDDTLTAPAGVTARTAVRLAALAAAGLWSAVVLLGGASAGPLSADGAVASAGAGASLLLASVSRPARRGPAAGGALALSLLTTGLALAAGSESATSTLPVFALAAGVGVVAVTTAREGDGGIAAAAVALLGMVAVASGLVQQSAGASTVSRGAFGPGLFLMIGGALIATAGALRLRRSASMLLPVGLTIAVSAGTTLASEGAALVLAFVAFAVAGGWAASPGDRGGERPLVVVLAFVALAVAAVPAGALPGWAPLVEESASSSGVPAAWLLAVAAVVTGVVLVPAAALSALPGAAAFAVVVAAEPSPARLGVAALVVGAVVAAAVAVQRREASEAGGRGDDDDGLGLLAAGIPALAVGAWLLVAPTTWAWVGDTKLANWSDTVAVAAAGGLIGVIAAGVTGRVAVPRAPRVVAPDPAVAGVDPPGARGAALVSAVALGLALLALVVSS
ncbi:MAG: hypothetical protein KY447_08780 [Actinobacteria bacterium]|nr:hypothetical protein [Actinomycetota bacterium]MBW3642991.1 hypothetical protein [Actinomycetota bacterium]